MGSTPGPLETYCGNADTPGAVSAASTWHPPTTPPTPSTSKRQLTIARKQGRRWYAWRGRVGNATIIPTRSSQVHAQVILKSALVCPERPLTRQASYAGGRTATFSPCAPRDHPRPPLHHEQPGSYWGLEVGEH